MQRKRETHPRRQARGCAPVNNHFALYISDEAMDALCVIGGALLTAYMVALFFGAVPMP